MKRTIEKHLQKNIEFSHSTFTSIDLFAGAGGLSLGLKQASVHTICAVEMDKHAAETFRINFPEAEVLCADVRNVDFDKYSNKVDIVCGGPPCQPFSSGGLRNASKDERDMIPAFVDVVATVVPKAFMMENVFGLAVGERKKYLEAVVEKLETLGYNVSWSVLNAADYGVPQIRKRLIVIGVREGVFEFPAPTHGPKASLPYVTAGEALSGVVIKTTNKAKVTFARKPDLRPNPYHGQLYNGGGRPVNLNHPAPTLLASAGGNKTHFIDTQGHVVEYHTHLSQGGSPRVGELSGARRLTIEESAAIQTFPEDFAFSGPQSSQYRQIGNAVPPSFAAILGKALIQHLQNPNKKKPISKPPQLQLFPSGKIDIMAKSNKNSVVHQTVKHVIGTIDRFLSGKGLHTSELPKSDIRKSIDTLLKKQSASVRTACLFLTFYRLNNPDYNFEAIPVGSRGATGDKLLGAELKKRYITLGNVTSCFENIGSKGFQSNFNLFTDNRFEDYIAKISKVDTDEVEKAALYMASSFADSQDVPPALPNLDDTTLSFVKAKELFKQMIEVESGGFIPQFLVAALLKTLRAKQSIRVETHNPNAADTYDGTAGDIEEFVEDKLLRAYEVTVRPDWKNRLPDFRAKMDKANLSKYIILASGVNNDEELREPAAMALKIEPLQRDIAVVDIMDFLNVMAAELTASELRESLNEVHKLLIHPKIGGKQAHIEKFTQIVSGWIDSLVE